MGRTGPDAPALVAGACVLALAHVEELAMLVVVAGAEATAGLDGPP